MQVEKYWCMLQYFTAAYKLAVKVKLINNKCKRCAACFMKYIMQNFTAFYLFYNRLDDALY